MFSNSSQSLSHDCIRGWIFDVYPAGEGEIVVWIISESGERIRLIDKFEPKIYVSGSKEDVERLVSKLYRNHDIVAWGFAEKYAKPTDNQKSRVLELTLKDYRKAQNLTREILMLGDYSNYSLSKP